MGNQIESWGLSKFYWKNEWVETIYETIHEIPVMSLDKNETYIGASGKKIGIVHFDDSKRSVEIREKLKTAKDLDLYAIPNQNSKESFSQIRAINSESLGKLTLNGASAHPLFKYLKKNCESFYNHDTKSSKKNISSKAGVFLVENSKDKNEALVSYFDESKIDQLLEKLSKA